MVIQFDSEQHIADLHDINLSHQHPTSIKYREYGRMAAANLVNNLTKFHIRGHREIILLNHRVEVHQRQYGVVGMVRDQFPLTGQT